MQTRFIKGMIGLIGLTALCIAAWLERQTGLAGMVAILAIFYVVLWIVEERNALN